MLVGLDVVGPSNRLYVLLRTNSGSLTHPDISILQPSYPDLYNLSLHDALPISDDNFRRGADDDENRVIENEARLGRPYAEIAVSRKRSIARSRFLRFWERRIDGCDQASSHTRRPAMR